MSVELDSIRIVDMPDLGAFTASSSVVGEHLGSGRFGALAMSEYILGAANIRNYDGGAGNDDALRFRNALASGAKVIFVPPGSYTFKSRVVQPGPFFPDPPPCVLFVGLDNVKVIAYGAEFRIADALTGTPPDPPYDGAGTAHVGIMGDCHNISWHGGRFYGNTTGAGSAVNAGMWFYCVSGVLIEDTEWLGEYRNGPFNGVWMFDCTFRNNRSYGSGLGWDFAYVENMLIEGNRCEGGAGYANNIGSAAFKLFSDPNTHQFNTSGQTYAQVTWLSTGAVRQLRTDKISNNVRIIGNTFNKWRTGIALDGVDGVSICENTIRDGPFVAPTSASGITVSTSAQTVAFGAVTRDVFIHDNDIYANGGPGVQMAPHSTSGIGTIEIISNRIYDNQCTNAVAFLFSALVVGNFRLIGNDFTSRTGSAIQANPYNQTAMVAVAGSVVRENIGVVPYDQTGSFSTIAFSPLAFANPYAGTPRLQMQPDNNLVLYGTDTGGLDRPVLSVFMENDAAPLRIHTELAGAGGAPVVFDGYIIAQQGGGGSTSISVSDTVNYAGMFFTAAGVGFGPTGSDGHPSGSWATLNATTGLVSSVPARFNGTVGFNNTAPIAKPTVTGAKGANAALASLLTALASYGLVTDSTDA